MARHGLGWTKSHAQRLDLRAACQRWIGDPFHSRLKQLWGHIIAERRQARSMPAGHRPEDVPALSLVAGSRTPMRVDNPNLDHVADATNWRISSRRRTVMTGSRIGGSAKLAGQAPRTSPMSKPAADAI